jgi:hypothetical protein
VNSTGAFGARGGRGWGDFFPLLAPKSNRLVMAVGMIIRRWDGREGRGSGRMVICGGMIEEPDEGG